MGDFTLGCLLGQYDKAQSFDVASVAISGDGDMGSWDLFTDQNSFQFQSTIVHSSFQSLRLDINSNTAGSIILQYNYARNNDFFERVFPDITTHTARIDIWGGPITAADSGQFKLVMRDAGALLPATFFPFIGTGLTGLVRRETTELTSHSAIIIRIDRLVSETSDYAINIDDVLTQIDPITIHPDWTFREHANLIKSQHRTLGGKLSTYRWEKNFAWTVPLQFLSNSHADLINWWWENQFNLLFTLDTSDSEAIHTCRIVNQTQPIGSRNRPNENLWNGVLTLESLDKGSNVF